MPGIAELDHAFKIERAAIRKRRCRFRKFLAGALPNIHVDLHNLILDYVYMNRKILDFLYAIATRGGSRIHSMDTWMDRAGRLSIGEHIRFMNPDGTAAKRQTIRMTTQSIDLRLGSPFINSFMWDGIENPNRNFPQVCKLYNTRDDMIKYINACITRSGEDP